jgi:hypothetical protein
VFLSLVVRWSVGDFSNLFRSSDKLLKAKRIFFFFSYGWQKVENIVIEGTKNFNIDLKVHAADCFFFFFSYRLDDSTIMITAAELPKKKKYSLLMCLIAFNHSDADFTSNQHLY